MHRRHVVAAALGVALCTGAAPAGAAAEALTEGVGEARETVAETATGDAAEGGAPAPDGTVALLRDEGRVTCASLAEALAAARDGDTVAISGTHVIDEQIAIEDGRSLVLLAEGAATVRRSASFPLAGSKVAGMVRLDNGSSLTVTALDPDAGTLVLDGEDRDSDEAVVTLHGASSLTMAAGSVIRDAHCSWKPWGAVYVRSGSFVLDGGEIRDGLAMRNAAVAVESGGSFEMRAGLITANRSTYSESVVWTKGRVTMTGGTIAGNLSNVSSDGVVCVIAGGSLSMTGGTIGDNAARNSTGILVDAGGSLSLGGDARLEGTDRVGLRQGSALSVTSALSRHATDDPLELVLMDEWGVGRAVASCPSPEVARAALSCLSVVSGTSPEGVLSVGADPSDPARISVIEHEAAGFFQWLDEPFADDLCLRPREELLAEGALDEVRDAIDRRFADGDTPERRLRLAQLERVGRQLAYLSAHGDEARASVRELSQLGEPGAERGRTKQSYTFDNLDATGYYLRPGMVHELTLYLEADDPSKVALAWRQAGLTDTSSYTALNTRQRAGLANGENRVTVDLTGSTYGFMVYLRNDSANNRARARLESDDALDAGAVPVLGTSLGTHPVYLHDPSNPGAFWDFVQEVRCQAGLARADAAADMALLQMGDEGHAQFSISATALEAAYAGITTREDAVAYVERSNEAIQDRLEFFWAFDGYDAGEKNGPHAVSLMRVHTAFTRSVSVPSTMYAFERYFHMPEDTAAGFLSGESMYGWGMSHEYGHCLDNSVISVGEETNNLYSIAGSRRAGIQALSEGGGAFSPDALYHVNAVGATRRATANLERMAEDPSYVPDWYEGGDWGTYIWTHLVAWWNGLHFFDDWDYSGYDFSASPYTEEVARDVATYGAYGASVRILRADAEAVRELERLTAGIAEHDVRKYNRIAMAFTMGTGYDFAAYLHALGERDLTDEVRAFCARYPKMPRKVQYFSLETDAAIINGAAPYADEVAPVVTASVTDGEARVEATMPSEALAASTTAYELYRGDELVGFSRTGSFRVEAKEGDEPESFRVVAYDVRLNPSRAGRVDGAEEEPEEPEVPEETPEEEPEAPEETPEEAPEAPETPDETPDAPENGGAEKPEETPEAPEETPEETPEAPEIPEVPDEAPDEAPEQSPGDGGGDAGGDDQPDAPDSESDLPDTDAPDHESAADGTSAGTGSAPAGTALPETGDATPLVLDEARMMGLGALLMAVSSGALWRLWRER